LIRAKAVPGDVVLIQVSAPNAKGEYSMGLAADYLVPAVETARVVIAEINDRVPWTHTEKLFRREEFALVVESSRDPPEAPKAKFGETEKQIAAHASRFIPERATLEFGLGALPDAVCAALRGRKGLQVHSGTIGDGVADLLAEGAVGKATAAMLIGTRALFDAARENPAVRLRSSEYTHDPRVLAGIDRFVALNSAVEVDLTGQVNGEVARGSYLGAVGGALDFVRAANQSPGGLSLTLVSASRIVERLSGPVSTPRSEAGIVVSELGAADLRGCSLEERKRRMRAIAKP
jgi:acetyl-CoA hydrolase